MVNAHPIFMTVTAESWPIAGTFTISRGSKTHAEVVLVELSDGSARGRGECVPYARYGETVPGVIAAIEAQRDALAAGLDRLRLADIMPPGAARNALDCALWDLEAKRGGTRVASMLGLEPRPLVTAYTISLDTPDIMARAAGQASKRPLLKVKLGGDTSDGGDSARIAAVRGAAPQATLIVDANEGWRHDTLAANLAACTAARVALIEQPLPADNDNLLGSIDRSSIAICADESAHDRASLARLAGRYDAVNIKLDKTGGLTEALAMMDEARGLGLAVMIGCMVGTSLAMAPAVLLAQHAQYVDLDGPLLLARDREPALRYDGSTIYPPDAALWG